MLPLIAAMQIGRHTLCRQPPSNFNLQVRHKATPTTGDPVRIRIRTVKADLSRLIDHWQASRSSSVPLCIDRLAA